MHSPKEKRKQWQWMRAFKCIYDTYAKNAHGYEYVWARGSQIRVVYSKFSMLSLFYQGVGDKLIYWHIGHRLSDVAHLLTRDSYEKNRQKPKKKQRKIIIGQIININLNTDCDIYLELTMYNI